MTRYRPEIDGLRAVAVVPVILFHGNFQYFSGGYIGVDVFFVISGYLITRILMTDLEADRFSLIKFYERRARRILPALFSMLALCALVAWLWMPPSHLIDFSETLLSVIFFCSNIIFWQKLDYFAPDVESNPLLHTWSLSVEEQFYIFFPILLFVLWRSNKRFLTPVLIVLILSSFGLAVFASRITPGANFFLLPTRAWELGVGSLVAVWTLKYRISPNSFMSALGLGMICVAVFIFDRQTPFPSTATLLPVVGSALLILFAAPSNLTGKLLSSRAFVGVGLISYSAYLWHQPLLAFARFRVGGELDTLLTFALIATTFLVAYVSWRFIEQPFRAGPFSLLKSPKGVAWSSTLAALTLVVFAVGGIVGSGYPMRIAPSGNTFASLNIDQRLSANRGLEDECMGGPTRSNPCENQTAPRILLWGDSFAMHLGPALRQKVDASDIVQYTMPVCAPILGVSLVNKSYPRSWSQKCIEFNEKVLPWLQRTPSVEFVVMSSPMGILRHGVFSQDEEVHTRNIENVVIDHMKETGRAIRAAGAIPIFVSPPPRTGDDLSRCGVSKLIFDQEHDLNCFFSEDEIWPETHQIDALLSGLEPEIHIISLKDVICKSGRCNTFIDGVLVFQDKGHFSKEGAERLGKTFNFLETFQTLYELETGSNFDS